MSLMLHCGGQRASLLDLQNTRTPPRTKSHVPVPHFDYVNMVRTRLPNTWKIRKEEYAIHGWKLFGVLYIDRPTPKFIKPDDYEMMIGLRNDHGKQMTWSIALGSHVFVCDNLCISGTSVVHRKHTPRILHDLPGLIDGVMNNISTQGDTLDNDICAMKSRKMHTVEIHDLSVFLMDSGVLTPRTLKKALEEYRRPKHEQFQPRTMWSFVNACTEALKPPAERGNFNLHTERTITLHQICKDYRSYPELAWPNREGEKDIVITS